MCLVFKKVLFLFHSFNLSQGGASRGLLGEWAAHGEGEVSNVSYCANLNHTIGAHA